MFNDHLPVRFTVAKNYGDNYYSLKIANRSLNTRSIMPLEENRQYLAEIYDQSVFKNLQIVPNFNTLDIELADILPIIKRDDYFFTLLNSLIDSKQKDLYECFKMMILSYQKGRILLPVRFCKQPVLIEFDEKIAYVYYDVFGTSRLNLSSFLIENGFEKVVFALQNAKQVAALSPLDFGVFKSNFEMKG